MSKFTDYIGKQFGNPHGFVGKICCLIMNLINRPMYTRTVSLVNLENKSRILDVGFGNGFLLNRLDRLNREYDLYGIDISSDMMVAAEKRNRRAKKADRLHLEIGDCCTMPFEDEYFGAVTSINTIYFWDDTVKGLAEIRRCLKTGGQFYNVVYSREWLDKLSYTNYGFKKYSEDEFIQFGYDAGFAKADIHSIVKGKCYAVVYTK